MNRKSFSINWAIFFITLLICFAFIEIFLRLTWQVPADPFYGYPTGLAIPDDTKGYKYQPEFRGVFPNELFNKIEIRINSKGLRDVEHAYNKSGKYRILGLGDSVTFGAGIKVEDTYLSVLERLIRKDIDEKSDIIKAGIHSYDFDQEYTYYMEEGYQYNPDIVLIGVVLNDARLVDPVVVKEWTQKKLHQDKIEKENTAKTSQNILSNNCYTYKYLKTTLNQLIHYQDIKAQRDEYNKKYFYFVYHLWQDEPWDNYSKKLTILKAQAQSKKSSVVIVLFPYTQQFREAEYYGRIPQEKIAALALKQGIEVIDLYEILNRKDYRQFYLNSDNVHLNEKGNKLVGEFIYNEMIKKGLLKL